MHVDFFKAGRLDIEEYLQNNEELLAFYLQGIEIDSIDCC